MKQIIKTALCAIALSASLTGWAQSTDNNKFVVKAYANIGLGDAVKLNSDLPGISSSSSANDYGVDFGWTFWQKQRHSLEANIGIAYSASSVKMNLKNLDYTYSAAADADMDNDSYIRHYESVNLNQKYSLGRFIVPVYLSYGYRCTDWLKVHADLGVTLGFKVLSKLSELTGNGHCYGIYPQYDNLKIEESYLNDFGDNAYAKSTGDAPTANSFACSILPGAGVEFRIYGPLAADLSFRYAAGLTNQYNSVFKEVEPIDSRNAPVTYTVADGTQVKSLTDYAKSSKLSLISLKFTLIYRF